MTEAFVIDGERIRVSVQPSPRARKTLEVKFISRSEMVVKHPHNRDVDVDALLEKHRESIERSYHQYLKQKKLLDGDILLVGGTSHRVVVNRTSHIPSERVQLTENALTIILRDGEDLIFFLREWLKTQTRKIVDGLVELYHEELGCPSRIFITETARWGYCRKNGEVIINWQLSCLPTKLAEFVVIHELVHLQYLNHQSEFHSKMLNLLRDYQARESELKYYQTIEPEALENIRRI